MCPTGKISENRPEILLFGPPKPLFAHSVRQELGVGSARQCLTVLEIETGSQRLEFCKS